MMKVVSGVLSKFPVARAVVPLFFVVDDDINLLIIYYSLGIIDLKREMVFVLRFSKYLLRSILE